MEMLNFFIHAFLTPLLKKALRCSTPFLLLQISFGSLPKQSSAFWVIKRLLRLLHVKTSARMRNTIFCFNDLLNGF